MAIKDTRNASQRRYDQELKARERAEDRAYSEALRQGGSIAAAAAAERRVRHDWPLPPVSWT
jgi:hypothetical protein